MSESDIELIERVKNTAIFSLPGYAGHCHGLSLVDLFMEISGATAGQRVIDVGCGNGQAGLALQDRGLSVKWLDITDAALAPEIDRERFMRLAVWTPWPTCHQAHFAFCAHLLDRVPVEYLMLAVARIAANCDNLFVSIEHIPDLRAEAMLAPPQFVQDYAWWRDRLGSFPDGELIEARNLMNESVFYLKFRAW